MSRNSPVDAIRDSFGFDKLVDAMMTAGDQSSVKVANEPRPQPRRVFFSPPSVFLTMGEPQEFVMEGAVTGTFDAGPLGLYETDYDPIKGIKANYFLLNVPCPLFVLLESVKVDGHELLAEPQDGMEFAVTTRPIVLPTLLVAKPIVLRGQYSGLWDVPGANYEKGQQYQLMARFFGSPVY